MKNDVCIKAGSYCPICKGVVLADCRHDSSQFSVPMRYQRMEFNAQLQNEVERLRKIEAAAVACSEHPVWNDDQFYGLMMALQAALRGEVKS